ncbi:translocation/assembly module TamB domain-containing protein [Hankyongella ginsenosidimutans]|uniref:translocation/assembly module TamB domain-containing protein n=1 Tax=Hankyongella ginsenosidimutans TaxID=1763828 RepID=UPI001FE7B1E4|nr:translocation/assembly module TamB domain-containing protein [Hankyongella ginsenosidimutans]
MSSARGWPAAIRIALDDAALINRDDIDIDGTGIIDIAYGPDGGTISGKLDLPRARLRLGGAARAAIPQIEVRETGLTVRPVQEEKRRRKPWRLNLVINAPQRVNVSGKGLVSEWRGRLTTSGTVDAPQIDGRLDLIRGNYEFAGRRFDLSRGDITFSGGGINPTLDIVATAPIDGGTAVITIGGTGEQPRITFSSSPALPQDEVLARLLFGSSVANLSAPDAVQLASAVASLQSSGRGLDVVGQVQRLTGIDRIRVLGPDVKRGTGTVYAGGKYITDRVYVEVRTDGAGYTATVFEIALTRTLSILSELATLGGTNASIHWSRDY